MYIQKDNLIWIGGGTESVYILPSMANRHGLIAGATGTGKTVSLKVMAEAFSDMGVPVFLADIKGDVASMCKPGEPNHHVDDRVKDLNIEGFAYKAYPVRLFDVFGEKGVSVRTTISDMGPELLARIMQLNDTQAGVLNIIFHIADDKGMLLIDVKDLRSMLQYVGDHNDEFQTAYGNVSVQTIGTIQRSLLTLEDSGGDIFFGEPELDMNDWFACNETGQGIINLLACEKLVQSPLLYSTFLLWMLSTLYEMLPEVGDMEKPKMVFFFDEAHLLFNNAPKSLLDKVEQVARLIRSKGVGIYFITQSPSDIPDTVLSQLGHKIQHALRAYTPSDQKALKAAASSFRVNPAFDTEKTISELGTGEAVVSVLDEKGAPTIAQRVFILPPQSYMGTLDDDTRANMIKGNPLYGKYATTVDNASAYEALQKTAEDDKAAAEQAAKEAEEAKQKAIDDKEEAKKEAAEQKAADRKAEREEIQKEKRAAQRTRDVERAVGSIGRDVGKQLLRGLFGNRR